MTVLIGEEKVTIRIEEIDGRIFELGFPVQNDQKKAMADTDEDEDSLVSSDDEIPIGFSDGEEEESDEESRVQESSYMASSNKENIGKRKEEARADDFIEGAARLFEIKNVEESLESKEENNSEKEIINTPVVGPLFCGDTEDNTEHKGPSCESPNGKSISPVGKMEKENKENEQEDTEAQNKAFEGISDKLKVLLSKEMPLKEKIMILEKKTGYYRDDIDICEEKEKNPKKGNHFNRIVTGEKRITRSQMKQLINKEIADWKSTNSNTISDRSESSVKIGIEQRLEEIGDQCGFKRNKENERGRSKANYEEKKGENTGKK
ncbi:hypothetical protein L2E82_04185 [Cichorium intybus]|uniref:Uncharacterized protein n=1 Tax=Cichorium intybus TaxID=13427 RepID=A0ACB9H559_CICIN|nr:hypothetical protein L2E82_04185 [Cichorium intybus]